MYTCITRHQWVKVGHFMIYWSFTVCGSLGSLVCLKDLLDVFQSYHARIKRRGSLTVIDYACRKVTSLYICINIWQPAKGLHYASFSRWHFSNGWSQVCHAFQLLTGIFCYECLPHQTRLNLPSIYTEPVLCHFSQWINLFMFSVISSLAHEQ